MKTPAQIAKHPIHPMLIVFPVGLFIFSLICQLINLFEPEPTWRTVAIYTMAGGVIGGLLAAVPGFIDLLSLPVSRARTKGITHMSANLLVVILFLVAFFMAARGEQPDSVVFIISLIAVVILAFSGWLGGSMVYVHGVAVQEGAHL